MTTVPRILRTVIRTKVRIVTGTRARTVIKTRARIITKMIKTVSGQKAAPCQRGGFLHMIRKQAVIGKGGSYEISISYRED